MFQICRGSKLCFGAEATLPLGKERVVAVRKTIVALKQQELIGIAVGLEGIVIPTPPPTEMLVFRGFLDFLKFVLTTIFEHCTVLHVDPDPEPEGRRFRAFHYGIMACGRV